MNKLRRVAAMLSVIVIVGLVIGTFICGITGSKYFFGMLFLAIAVPVVLWIFMWFTRLLNGDSEVIPKEDMEALNDRKNTIKGETEPADRLRK